MSRTISVDVGIDEFSTNDLIDDLKRRTLTPDHIKQLKKNVKEEIDFEHGDPGNCIIMKGKVVYKIANLSDIMAVEEFVKRRK